MLTFDSLLIASDAIVILTAATMFWVSPRLKRNWVFGYGSRRSMANNVVWQAGNRFAGMVMALAGLAAMSIQVCIRPAITTSEFAQVVCAASLLVLPFLVMYITERYLARVFGS